MRVALLAHSTNPRGGVVHAIELADALNQSGVEAVLHAPDASGRGFFRQTAARSVAFPVAPARPTLADMVKQRIADYVEWFEAPAHRGFDIYHAQDGISANALRELQRRGLIAGYARTAHHVDAFADASVALWERQSIEDASALFVVSEYWRERLRAEHGRDAQNVGNGVDLARFTPQPDGREAALRARLGLGDGPIILNLGGVEARKNTLRLLQAFSQTLTRWPTAELVIAGGASLLDHSDYQAQCFADTDLARVRLPGRIDDADMPALYRLADVVAVPSLNEGFGLSVIEALATDKPVVVSDIAPFTGYLAAHEAQWCDPRHPASIAAALARALTIPPRGGRSVASRFAWADVARRHLPVYQTMSAYADA